MNRRSELVPQKDILRNMVLKRGGDRGPGVMTLSEILRSREFKGYDEDDLRRYIYQLRLQYKGTDMGYGTEAWELLDRVVIGLERLLSQAMRRRIQLRRHAKERGVAEQTMLDNVVFRGRIEHDGVAHREEIVHSLESSSSDLARAASSSDAVRETLVEHREDFPEG